MKKIVLLGGGGYFSSVVDSIRTSTDYEIVGVTDPVLVGEHFGVPVLGTDDILPELYRAGIHYAHITVGSVGNYRPRKRLVELAESIGFELVSIVDRTACISSDVTLGKMSYVAKNVTINTDVVIGDYCMINTACVIEHGCRISDYVHVAPAAAIAGDVHIGYGSHVGINATLLQGITIGDNVIIGAGSTVIGDVDSDQTVYGVVKGNRR